MSNPEAPTLFFLDIQPSVSEDWGVKDSVYIPVSPADVDRHRTAGWSAYELAKRAWDSIPPEFPEERAKAEKILSNFEEQGGKIVLSAYGPEEGDYYIALRNVDEDSEVITKPGENNGET